MADWLSAWLKTPSAQVALAIATVMIVAAIVFAIIWSIVDNQPLSPVVGNLIAFLTGGGVTLVGGGLGARGHAAGVSQGAIVSNPTETPNP